jgi:hypothetical protein
MQARTACDRSAPYDNERIPVLHEGDQKILSWPAGERATQLGVTLARFWVARSQLSLRRAMTFIFPISSEMDTGDHHRF